MREEYITAEIELVEFTADDVIATSCSDFVPRENEGGLL